MFTWFSTKSWEDVERDWEWKGKQSKKHEHNATCDAAHHVDVLRVEVHKGFRSKKQQQKHNIYILNIDISEL